LLLCGAATAISAQTVSPVIVEYKVKAEGRIDLTNNTLEPMAVVLEPKSFDISPDGNGLYRPLDPGIHLQLSSTSFRVDPGQTYYVFYKAKSDKLPAWFTIYAAFSAVRHSKGLDVRMLLPHTVYIYPKKQLGHDEVHLTTVEFVKSAKQVAFDVENTGPDLERVQEVRVSSGSVSASGPGFPLLPGGRRHITIDWKSELPPNTIDLRMEHGSLKKVFPAGTQ
jgi:hypothetical protein